jgi:formate hydrogenlyase subunit 4
MSVRREIALGEYILGSLISGVFLFSAKSATPEGNRKRLSALLITMMLVQLTLTVFQNW